MPIAIKKTEPTSKKKWKKSIAVILITITSITMLMWIFTFQKPGNPKLKYERSRIEINSPEVKVDKALEVLEKRISQESKK